MFLPLLIIICALSVLYLRKFRDHWKNRSVPSTGPNLLYDFKTFTIGTKNFGLILEDVYKKFPNERFCGFYQLFRSTLMIRDPNLIGNIVVNDFAYFYDRSSVKNLGGKLSFHLFNLQGPKWKTVRGKLVPTFTSSKLRLMFNMMVHCSQILDTEIKTYTERDESIDVREVMARFTTDIIGTCAFGLEFNALTDPESQYRKIGKRIFTPTFKTIVAGLIRFVSPNLLKLLRMSEIPPDVESFFFDLLKRTEEHRKTEANRRNDFMQLMLDIKERDMKDLSRKNDENDVLFDDKILASNMFLFYLAGFETTASTLSFCLYELGLNPEMQNKVRAEIIKVRDEHGGKITYDALKKLTFMEMVLSETLRKYNPATIIIRVCTKTYQIPDSHVVLHPGDRVTIPVHAIHHDEKYYPDPEKFDPERFSEENNAKRIPNTFLPFGDGPRICIGLRFAKVEMKICLSSLLLKYKFEKCDKTEIPIKINPRGFLYTPKNGIYLKVSEIWSN